MLGGSRALRGGDRIRVEVFRPFGNDAAGSTAVLFVRSKQDDRQGRPNPKALASEVGLWRLVSHQGVYVDRGDGVPINPISEATRLVASSASRTVPLDEFVFGNNLPNPSEQPVAAQARKLTMDEFLRVVIDAAG